MTQPSYPAPIEPPKEWEMAEEVAMHFNDLLMRIRTFALPFIATAIGAGTALGLDALPQIRAPWIVLVILCTAGAVAFLALARWLSAGQTDDEQSVQQSDHELSLQQSDGEYSDDRLSVKRPELGLLGAVGTSCALWAVLLGLERPVSFLFSAPVLIFGGLLLFLIYLLDRFYYTSLLLGAVTRAEEIEDSLSQQINLSHKITSAAPTWTFTMLPAALYLIPVVILLNAGLATATYSQSREATGAVCSSWSSARHQRARDAHDDGDVKYIETQLRRCQKNVPERFDER